MTATAPPRGNVFQRLSPATRRWIALGAWFVATALVAVAFHTIGWHETVRALRQANPLWLAIAALANLSIIALWTWQTLIFLPREFRVGERRVTFPRLFEVMALTTTATNTVPAFLGQATGVALLAEGGGVGAAIALSVLAQHQMVEGIAKVAMLLVAARVAPLPHWMHDALVGMAIAVTTLFVALVAFSRAASRRAAPRMPNGGRLARLRTFAEQWAANLVALRSPGRFTAGLLIALAMKAVEAGGWFAVERAFAVAPKPGSAFLALGAVNIASSISASPGNLGVYEAAAYFVYNSLHVPREMAFALAVAGHLCYLIPLAGTGYLILSVREVRQVLKKGEA